MSVQGAGQHGGARHAMPFDQVVADEVLDRISTGQGLEEICEDSHIPSRWAIRKWMAAETIFNTSYALAREMQMDCWADDIVRISDDSTNDYMDRQRSDGTTERVVDPENVQRSKLRIDTRKWIMSKLAGKYADKVDIAVNAQINVNTFSDQELEDRTRARLVALGVQVGTQPLLLGLAKPVASEPEPDLEPESDDSC